MKGYGVRMSGAIMKRLWEKTPRCVSDGGVRRALLLVATSAVLVQDLARDSAHVRGHECAGDHLDDHPDDRIDDYVDEYTGQDATLLYSEAHL